MTKTTSTAIIATLSIVILFGIGYVALNSNSNTNTTQSSSSNSQTTMDGMQGGSMMMGMTNMSELMKDDQSFLENMIPHHQEAVDSSKQVLVSTKDPELKVFVQDVITAQNKEITDMKTWYKQWFNKDYVLNTSYQAMMNGTTGKSGLELDKEYIKGMIMHHQGAIEMAIKIQTITKRQELLTLASNIISSQTKEKATLMSWMMSKYNDHGMMNR